MPSRGGRRRSALRGFARRQAESRAQSPGPGSEGACGRFRIGESRWGKRGRCQGFGAHVARPMRRGRARNIAFPDTDPVPRRSCHSSQGGDSPPIAAGESTTSRTTHSLREEVRMGKRLTRVQVDSFHEHGFLPGIDMFGEDECDAFRSRVEAFERTRPEAVAWAFDIKTNLLFDWVYSTEPRSASPRRHRGPDRPRRSAHQFHLPHQGAGLRDVLRLAPGCRPHPGGARVRARLHRHQRGDPGQWLLARHPRVAA